MSGEVQDAFFLLYLFVLCFVIFLMSLIYTLKKQLNETRGMISKLLDEFKESDNINNNKSKETNAKVKIISKDGIKYGNSNDITK